jgi:spoIIIJ-associated protein
VDDRKYSIDKIGPQIEGLLGAILDRAGFELSFAIQEGQSPHPEIENPEVVVKFSGADVDMLLENKAELLLALEHVTMEALGIPSEDHSRLCFDAEDYRLLRIEELRVSAITAAEKVKKTRAPFRFSPMTSRERRIIHLALRNESEVRSESAGMGGFRQVVIYPADMPTPPQGAVAPPPDRGRPMGRRGGGRRR